MDIDDLSKECIAHMILLHERLGLASFYSKEGFPKGISEAVEKQLCKVREISPSKYDMWFTKEGEEIAEKLHFLYCL